MAHKNTPKVTPATAEMNYEKLITDKAKEYAPMIKEAFPTQSSLLMRWITPSVSLTRLLTLLTAR